MGFEPSRLRRFAVLVAQVSLGVVFVASGSWKIYHPDEFLTSVSDYQLVGPKLAVLTASGLPWLELIIGLSLLMGLFPGGALITSSLLLSLFTLVQISALARGLQIGCGCFGPASAETVSYASISRTALLSVMSFGTLIWFVKDR